MSHRSRSGSRARSLSPSKLVGTLRRMNLAKINDEGALTKLKDKFQSLLDKAVESRQHKSEHAGDLLKAWTELAKAHQEAIEDIENEIKAAEKKKDDELNIIKLNRRRVELQVDAVDCELKILELDVVKNASTKDHSKALRTHLKARSAYKKDQYLWDSKEQRFLRNNYETNEETTTVRMLYDQFLGDIAELQTYKEFKNAKREGTDNSGFRDGLIKAYDSRHSEEKRDYLWCPINKDYYHKGEMIAAHIIPAQFPKELVRQLLGDDAAAEMMSPLNGIMMHNKAEKAFDRGNILIVLKEGTDNQYEVVSVEEEVFVGKKIRLPANAEVGSENTTAKDIDGTILEFKNDFRPRKRYMFLKSTLLRAKALKVESISSEAYLKVHELADRKPWLTMGRWLMPMQLLKDVVAFYGFEWDPESWVDAMALETDAPLPNQRGRGRISFTELPQIQRTSILSMGMSVLDGDILDGDV